MKRIIVRTPNFIGDTVNITPCLELVKKEYPDAELIIVGPEFVKDIFKYDKQVSGFITFSSKKKEKNCPLIFPSSKNCVNTEEI